MIETDGVDALTAERLADVAGISRRTFFNHVDSKESAVLGALPHLTDELATRLREEAVVPGEDLLEITLRVAAATVSAQETEVEDWRRLHDVLVRNPELIPRFHERLEALFDALVEHLDVAGVIVVVEAEHLCMSMRGVRKPGATTITSAVRGQLRDSTTRAEAMALLTGAAR